MNLPKKSVLILLIKCGKIMIGLKWQLNVPQIIINILLINKLKYKLKESFYRK